jgi:RecT family
MNDGPHRTIGPSDTLVPEPPPTPPTITPEHLALIKLTVAKEATDAELQLFIYDNLRRGVHPLDRLIHFSKRAGRYVPIVGIDFMRQRAHATGACCGIEDAIFTGRPKAADFVATVTVWRLVQGQRCAFSASARWSEYKPDQDFMWQRMPHVMLGKVAEALALRRAFPQELTGVFSSEELAHAEDENAAPPAASSAKPVKPFTPHEHLPITEPMRKKLFALAKEKAWPMDVFRQMLSDKFGTEHTTDLRRGDYDEVLRLVNRGPSPTAAASEPAEEKSTNEDVPF